MGTDTETKSSNPSEMQPLEEFDPKKEPVGEHDESDVIEPLNKATDDTGDQEQENESDTPEDRDAGEPEIPLDEVDGQVESDVKEATDDASDESEIHLDKTDIEVNEPDSNGDSDSSDKEEQPAGDSPKEPAEDN